MYLLRKYLLMQVFLYKIYNMVVCLVYIIKQLNMAVAY